MDADCINYDYLIVNALIFISFTLFFIFVQQGRQKKRKKIEK